MLLDLSIVVPLFNEEESLPELMAWIDRVCRGQGYQYEVLMVDDGSTDTSWAVIEQLAQQYAAVRGIRFQRNYGKSAALNEGFKRRTAAWSSRWTPTCRTVRTRFRACIK